jgi:hypothetical protein
MDIITIITSILTIIGGATMILRIIAPLTKNNVDNKVLFFLESLLEIVSFDSKSKILTLNDSEKITIKIKK